MVDESRIKCEAVSLTYPIYGIKHQSLRNLITSFFFRKSDPGTIYVDALKDISLILSAGDRLGVLGGNGSGKSTLLRVLSGIFSPSRGTCKVSGSVHSITDPSLGLDQLLSGRENILLRAKLWNLPAGKLLAFEHDVIEFCDLGEFIDLPVYTYSSGMVMRLNFALSVNYHTNILILDEWLSVTDEKFKLKAEEAMVNLVKKSDILVIASHDLDMIKKICSRVIVLEKGKIVFDGNADLAVQFYKTLT